MAGSRYKYKVTIDLTEYDSEPESTAPRQPSSGPVAIKRDLASGSASNLLPPANTTAVRSSVSAVDSSILEDPRDRDMKPAARQPERTGSDTARVAAPPLGAPAQESALSTKQEAASSRDASGAGVAKTTIIHEIHEPTYIYTEPGVQTTLSGSASGATPCPNSEISSREREMAGDTSSDVTPIPDVRFVFKNVVFLSKLGKCRSHQQFGTIKQLVDGVQRHTDGSCFLHIGKYQVTLTQGKKELGSWKGQTWDLAYGSNGWCLCDQLHCSSGEDNGEWGRTRERIRKAHIRDPGKLINTSAIGKKREGPIGRTADGTSEDANKRIKLEARQNAEEGDKPGTTSTAPPRTQSEAMIVVKQEGHA